MFVSDRGSLPKLAVKKDILRHGLDDVLRHIELISLARIEGLFFGIPKRSYPIILFEHPPDGRRGGGKRMVDDWFG